jgi:hypothetical protein
MGSVPMYPTVLTNANWQSNKGKIAKLLKGKTGIGAELVALQRKYNAIKWQLFDPKVGGPLPKPRTMQEVDERWEQAMKARPQLDALRKDIFATRDKIKRLGDEWTKSKVVPAASANHLKVTMVKAAEQLAQDIKDIDDSGYKSVREEIQRVEQIATQMLAKWVKGVEGAVPKVKTTPTVAKYQEVLHQQVRGLGTAISKMPRYKAIYTSDWEKKVGDGFMSGVKDGEPVKKKVAEVEAALQRFKRAQGG